MKKKVLGLLLGLLLCSVFPAAVKAQEAALGNIGVTYYVDSNAGNDANSGTSESEPWRSLDKVTATTFQPGDKILLKSGSVWNGEWLWPKGSGVEGAPIIIDKYGGDAKPIINGMGIDRGLNRSGAVHLRNQEYWEIRNLEVTNDDDFSVDIDLARGQGDNSWSSKDKTRNGILLIVDGDELEEGEDGIMDHIYIENCYIHDVDGPNDWNDTFTGGIIFNVVGSKLRPSTTYRDIRIAYNTIRKVDLLGITGFVGTTKSDYQDEIGPNDLWMRDVYIGHNYMEDIAQGGIDLCDAKDAVVEYNVIDGFLKRYPTFRPTVALYPWKSENAVFQYNEVYNGPSTNADGSPYDMDSGLKDVVYQFNYSHNNPCGWMLYMGKNDNDIIRYNISDDGGDFIIKYFLTPCSTPTYFVNNVIMYDGAKTKFMHRDPFKSKTYFYNNVFYNKNTSVTTTWHDNSKYLGNMGDIEFYNNCFYEASGIHSQYEPYDPYKVTANPQMVNPGMAPQKNDKGILSGATIWDGYKITENSPLVDAGVYIPQMGQYDFYGTQLYYGESPDIGVHELVHGEQTIPREVTNLAHGSMVTSNNSHPDLTPGRMTDGVGTEVSRWAASNSQLPIDIEVTLKKEQKIDTLVLKENIVPKWASERIAKLELERWNGSSYEHVCYYYGNIGKQKEIRFKEITTSKLRLRILELKRDVTVNGQGSSDPSIREIELYYYGRGASGNLALNKEVRANNSHETLVPSHMTDGVNSHDSRWAAANSDSLPITLDLNLGAKTQVNAVKIYENIIPDWAEGRIRDFTLKGICNGEEKTILTFSGYIGAEKAFCFGSTEVESLRIEITGLKPDTSANSTGQTDPSIRELEVYNY